jgi:hypothetical protein
MKMNDIETDVLIKQHFYNLLKFGYRYTLPELRKKVKTKGRQADFFTVGLVRQLVKDGKMRRFEVEGKTFYMKK